MATQGKKQDVSQSNTKALRHPHAVAQLRDDWDIICRQALNINPQLGVLLTGCRPFDCIEDHLLLQPISDQLDVSLLAPSSPDREYAQHLIREHLNLPLDITLVGRAEHGPSASIPAQRPAAYRAAQSNPQVLALLKAFDADIIAQEPSLHAQWLRDHLPEHIPEQTPEIKHSENNPDNVE